jgi:hypothetical protein
MVTSNMHIQEPGMEFSLPIIASSKADISDILVLKSDHHNTFDEHDVLLDNQATKSIFRNSSLLKTVRIAPEPTHFTGIGGKIIVNMIGDHDYFGTIYCSPKSLANILSLSEVEEKYKVTYQQSKGFKIAVDDNKEIWFTKKNNLFVVANFKEQNVYNLQTVSQNETQYSKREV